MVIKMLSSMTGFGRSTISTPLGQLIIEIQSLNRKFFEAVILLPKEYMRYEIEIRKWISEKVSRGQVIVRMQLVPKPDSKEDYHSDVHILKKLKAKWTYIAKELGFENKGIDFPFLVRQYEQLHPLLLIEDEEVLLQALKKGVANALKDLLVMRKAEGKHLAEDLLIRIDLLEKKIQEISKFAPKVADNYQARLKKKLEEFCGVDDERILKEIAIYADRVDITEEMIRFQSHLKQLSQLIKKNETVKGRKMEFLLQELLREINTIGAKACLVEMSKKVLEIKNELEKVREQIQNIE